MSVLFVGGPWHGKVENYPQLPLIRIPLPIEYGTFSGDLNGTIIDYMPLEYGTASSTDYYLRFRVYTPKGEKPERDMLLDALVQTLYKTDLGKDLGIEKIERLW